MNKSNISTYIQHSTPKFSLFLEIASHLLEIICYLIPVMTLIGSIGNTLVFAVFSSKKLKKSGFVFYFSDMSISDTVVLIHLALYWAITTRGFILQGLSDITCKLTEYSNLIASATSVWLL